jgi:hypothetical protein
VETDSISQRQKYTAHLGQDGESLSSIATTFVTPNVETTKRLHHSLKPRQKYGCTTRSSMRNCPYVTNGQQRRLCDDVRDPTFAKIKFQPVEKNYDRCLSEFRLWSELRERVIW